MFARRCTISCASSIYTFLFMFRMWRETARKNVNEIPAWSVSRGRSRGRPCHGIETRSFLYFRLCEIFWDRQTRPDSCLRRSCISFLRGRKFTWIKEKWNYRSIFSRTFEEEVNGTRKRFQNAQLRHFVCPRKTRGCTRDSLEPIIANSTLRLSLLLFRLILFSY